MALVYIRDRYRVPARRGMRVTVNGHLGTIQGARGPRLWVQFDDGYSLSCHPTWGVVYLDGKEGAQ
jgi:hypothetical protein